MTHDIYKYHLLNDYDSDKVYITLFSVPVNTLKD